MNRIHFLRKKEKKGREGNRGSKCGKVLRIVEAM